MNNHDQKSTSLYRGPCDRGAVVSWESTSVAAPKGQKGLFERAFYESRLRGRPRNIYIQHSRGDRLLQLLQLLPLLLAGRAHLQDGAVAGHPGLDVRGRSFPFLPSNCPSIFLRLKTGWGASIPPRGGVAR